jgi:hypothetical protein
MGVSVGAYLSALGLTLLIEVPVYAAGLAGLLEVRLLRGMVAGVIVNLVTHPLSFLLIVPALQPRIGYWPALVVVEVAVWPAEALMLYAWLRRDLGTLLGLSFVANGLSLGIGLLR